MAGRSRALRASGGRRRLLLNAVFLASGDVRSLPGERRGVIGLKDEPFVVRWDYSERVAHLCGCAPTSDD